MSEIPSTILSAGGREEASPVLSPPKRRSRDLVLNEREKLILRAVVQHYILTADPLGSRVLARRLGWHLSPATIRNVMADLEELGVLTQPHPSAGRLPTSLGYRLYVDDLMQVEDLTEEEKKFIQDHLEGVFPRVDELMEQVSSLLAEVSRLLGFIMEPNISSGVLEKVEIVPVAEGRVVLLIIVRSGLVKSIMLELNSSIRKEEIAQASRLINQRLAGLRLTEIPLKVHERLRGEWSSSNPVIRLVMEFPEKVFSTEIRGEVHLGPTSHIIEQPEFAHLKRIKGIIELLDNKDVIVHLLKDQTEGVNVTIGEENPGEEFKDFSVITSTYRVGDVSGTLGIIGPTRMNYAKLISLVNYTAQLVTQRISQR